MSQAQEYRGVPCQIVKGTEIPTPAAVMGGNVKRLRGAHTTEELAACAQKRGLNWGTARIAELEHGKVSPTAPTIYWLCLALADLLGPRRAVSPVELFEGDGLVRTPAGDIERALLRTVLSPTPVTAPKPVVTAAEHWSERVIADWSDHLADQPMRLIRDVRVAMKDTDLRVAADLGVDPLTAAAGMAKLWQKPLSAKRNEIAEEVGPGMSPQRKGRFTRDLKEELRKVLNR